MTTTQIQVEEWRSRQTDLIDCRRCVKPITLKACLKFQRSKLNYQVHSRVEDDEILAHRYEKCQECPHFNPQHVGRVLKYSEVVSKIRFNPDDRIRQEMIKRHEDRRAAAAVNPNVQDPTLFERNPTKTSPNVRRGILRQIAGNPNFAWRKGLSGKYGG